MEVEFQIPNEQQSTSWYFGSSCSLDRISTYFTGMDAERAAHFVKELRILEKDILDLNKRIESIEQCDCLLNDVLEKCDFKKGENGGIRVQSRPPF